MQTINYKDYSSKDRLFFVGDIHGQYKLFLEGLEILQLTERDQMVSVGDLIDRGDQSIECLTHFLHANNCDAVMGNHDHFLVKAMESRNPQEYVLWLINGGDWAEKTPHALVAGLAKAADEKFPVLMMIDYKGTKVAVSHAEIPGDDIHVLKKRLAPITGNAMDADVLDAMVRQQKLKEHFLWGREKLRDPECDMYEPNVAGVDLTVHGHTVTQMVREDKEPLPVQIGNQHWIDTGSCFGGGRLTFAELVEGELQYTQVWYDEFGELCVI